ncbi:MAG: c-type cytochrome [Dehalococcoidia bacterium]|nr:c-type cytochrome [Dehalococcoidia bacterium]
MNPLRATGVKEGLIIRVSMVVGAVFVFYAYNLGIGARPEEMRVWGNTEAAVVATSPGSSSSGTAILASPTVAPTRAAIATVAAPTAAAPTVAASTAVAPTVVPPTAVAPTAPAQTAVAPTVVPPTAVPPTVAASSSASLGKAVFDKGCTGCHPGGNKGVGPAINTADFKQRYPQDSDIENVIRKGKGTMMPAFSAAQVSDNDLKNLVSFIKSLVP